MKRNLILLLILFFSGCVIATNKKETTLTCVNETMGKESKIVLYFTKDVLSSYTHYSKTIYPFDEYVKYRDSEDGVKIGFVFNDKEKSITYVVSESAPFKYENTPNIPESSKYDDLKEFYLNKNYTCDGVKSTQIDPVEVLNDNFAFYGDKIYFIDPYTGYLTRTNLEGKNKEVILDSDVNILFIIGDYLYYEYNFEYYNISLVDNSINSVTLVNFEYATLNNENFNTSNTNNYLIYNSKLISYVDNTVYYGDNIIYKGDYEDISINGIYLFLVNNKGIVKYNLETMKEEASISLDVVMATHSKDYIYIYRDFKLYEMDYINFEENLKYEFNNLEFDSLDYVNGNIYLSYNISDLFDETYNLAVLDSEFNVSYIKNIKTYQIANNNIYIVSNDGNIIIK